MVREYGSSVGQWMSPDQFSGSYDMSMPQSLKRYMYVENNPLSASDASGQMMLLPSPSIDPLSLAFDIGVLFADLDLFGAFGGGQQFTGNVKAQHVFSHPTQQSDVSYHMSTRYSVPSAGGTYTAYFTAGTLAVTTIARCAAQIANAVSAASLLPKTRRSSFKIC